MGNLILGKIDIDDEMNDDQVSGHCEANNSDDDDPNIEIKENINIMIDINMNVTTTNMDLSGKRVLWL